MYAYQRVMIILGILCYVVNYNNQYYTKVQAWLLLYQRASTFAKIAFTWFQISWQGVFCTEAKRFKDKRILPVRGICVFNGNADMSNTSPLTNCKL